MKAIMRAHLRLSLKQIVMPEIIHCCYIFRGTLSLLMQPFYAGGQLVVNPIGLQISGIHLFRTGVEVFLSFCPTYFSLLHKS